MSLILLCGALLPAIEGMVSSFPEMLMGQWVMARQTKPLSPSAYQSADFVLGQTAFPEIEGGVFIALDEDVLFWDPQYVGFPRTELNEDEIRALQQLLSSGNLFYQTSDGTSYQCVTPLPGGEPALETCAHGEQWMDRYLSYRWDAQQNHRVGVLQIFLTDGRLVEIRLYPSENGLAYTPHEKNVGRQLTGIAASPPLLNELSGRAALPPIPILWPEMTAAQANARAARTIGQQYRLAMAVLQNSPAVRDVFGEVQEVRPATGLNYTSSWMDSTAVFLTFRVIGARGEGAAIVQGYDCFNLDMVFQGISFNSAGSSICR